MSDEDEQFQQRWGLRKKDSDVDSSSDDQPRRPGSVSEPKQNKRKIATCLFPDKDDQNSIMYSPQTHPEDENHLSDEERDKDQNKSCKKERRKARRKKPDRKTFDHDPLFDGASIDLSGYMESLVEGVKVAREGLLKWMNDELDESSKDNDKTSHPVAAKMKQRRGNNEPQSTTPERKKNPRGNPAKAGRKSGMNTITQNPEEGSSDKLAKDSKTSHETSEVVAPSNKPAVNVASGAIPEENNQNQNQKQKGKRLGASSKKQKVVESDQQTEKAPATAGSASASNYLTLPAVLPRQELENSERTNSECENVERAMKSRNAQMNQSINFTPRSQQKDGFFSQNGLRNISDYEQNTTPTSGNMWGAGNGNGNANGFPFGLHSQGLNGGIGMPNFPSQFGLQYLSQESILSGLRMNGGHPILPTGNHSFSESYGAYNQQLRFKAQSGLMPLHSSDNTRTGNLQPR